MVPDPVAVRLSLVAADIQDNIQRMSAVLADPEQSDDPAWVRGYLAGLRTALQYVWHGETRPLSPSTDPCDAEIARLRAGIAEAIATLPRHHAWCGVARPGDCRCNEGAGQRLLRALLQEGAPDGS